MLGPKLQSTRLRVFQKLKRFEVNNPDSIGNECKTVVTIVTMRYAKLRCYAYKFLGFGYCGGQEDLASR